jgi:hypothetical protein
MLTVFRALTMATDLCNVLLRARCVQRFVAPANDERCIFDRDDSFMQHPQ